MLQYSSKKRNTGIIPTKEIWYDPWAYLPVQGVKGD